MALKRIKTNTQKQETKDTPHTNGKYKIRQTITKIMEYTHKTPVNKTKIRLIIFSAAKVGEALYSQQKQDQELTVAQIMNSLLPNSDLNLRK